MIESHVITRYSERFLVIGGFQEVYREGVIVVPVSNGIHSRAMPDQLEMVEALYV